MQGGVNGSLQPRLGPVNTIFTVLFRFSFKLFNLPQPSTWLISASLESALSAGTIKKASSAYFSRLLFMLCAFKSEAATTNDAWPTAEP